MKIPSLFQSLPFWALGCSALLFSVSSCARAPEAPPKEVVIHADDHMKFDVTAFEVTRGQKVSVTLKNVGTTPKFSMGHNFLLLDRNVNEQNVTKFLDAASTEASNDYVPPGSKDVLAHTKLLGPGESDTVTFDAPQVPGVYLYLCSFPGHYSQGTKGFMTVK
ncbi:MAG: plastocyanin/azurin family copper-binding protein [Chthoniobacterales bacterium]